MHKLPVLPGSLGDVSIWIALLRINQDGLKLLFTYFREEKRQEGGEEGWSKERRREGGKEMERKR